MALLKTNNMTMKFGGLTAVNNFNLELNKGEIVALIGPNGAGKTTAFNMITGVYKPTSGTIIYKDTNITGVKPHEITKHGLARTFQNIRLFKELSVLDNVLIANHLNVESGILRAATANIFEYLSYVGHLLPESLKSKVFKGDSPSRGYKKEEKEILEKSLFLLERVGLIDLKDEKASSLPYGLQRRLEIARALATQPEVLLLDEPAAGMNPKETEDLTSFIQKIRSEFDLTVFMIEHHMPVVMGISDRIYVLDYGITIAQGSPQEIQNNERVIQAYLGVSEDA